MHSSNVGFFGMADISCGMTVYIDSTENNSLLIIFYLIYSWVKDLPVAERLSIWNDIKKFIRFWKSLPKSGRPYCKIYNHVRNALTDILMPAISYSFSVLLLE